MNERGIEHGLEVAVFPLDSVAAAKARLLHWADETDAHNREEMRVIGPIPLSAIAALGGIIVTRLLRPSPNRGSTTSLGKAVVKLGRWALVARVAKALLPHAINLVQRRLL